MFPCTVFVRILNMKLGQRSRTCGTITYMYMHQTQCWLNQSPFLKYAPGRCQIIHKGSRQRQVESCITDYIQQYSVVGITVRDSSPNV